MRWPGFWFRRRTFCCWMSPRTTWTCAPRTFLLDAIAAFSGTVVFVSHDRYFIERLATRILEVEGGTVTSHEGNYEEFLRWKEAQAVGSSAAEPAPKAKEVAATTESVAAASQDGRRRQRTELGG